ncbi:hypothetical protein [Ancylobacter defluvii]|uniref:Uncharacterized protein n=1 Tax=Ancylobacter defluvii TaxID=1282440 RepID=A0A9W6N908_9HYPH|nr:hypothetical protein [Ancylobacter defluvii]MBS7589824.1 hypothetical protein [Ancylobacter defluvii]GLK82944.1 hypothetical protein GCM10017653_10130 [Ancylobacter defluvii]
MTPQICDGHRASLRAARVAFIGLAAATGVALAVSSAGAQWIGTPGGSTESSPPAVSATPAPAATAAPAATPAPAPSLGGVDPDLGSAGLASPSLSSPSLAAPSAAPSMTMPGGMVQQPSADMADCQTNVGKLRTDIEARGGALQAATKKKLPPSELCPLFRNFASSQQKFLTYLRTNKTKCGVPDEVLTKLRENTTSISGVRDKVCKVAADMQSGGGSGPSGPPQQGAVAAGLGLSSGLPGVSANKPGGVFDTLGGSALR